MASTPPKTSTPKRKSPTRRATTAKPAAKAAPVADKPAADDVKTAPVSAAPVPKLVTVSTPVVAEADLKKRELIDLVVEKSGIKKKDAKPVVEAMLAVLGETIAAGRELNLQPLGKLRINRAEEKSNGRIIVCKLRQSLPGAGAKEGLADEPE